MIILIVIINLNTKVIDYNQHCQKHTMRIFMNRIAKIEIKDKMFMQSIIWKQMSLM